ncbi:hypothetical protein BBJ28_00017960 [Nothophytophthora sp. Chile5]|nr:hypothetical protein BBJ28_00017960 [Nothophytophthora sp. Chile5]
MSRDVFSQERKAACAVTIEQVSATWQSIEAQLDSATHRRNQLVLETTVQYSEDQPVLSAAKLRPQEAFQDRRSGRLDLGDTVKSAEQLIRRVRGCIQQGDSGESASAQDTAPIVDASNRHLATLTNMVQQLQRVLTKLKDANELEARGLSSELATQKETADGKGAASLAGHAIKLCPPTPALPPHEEAQLARSLKKVSMTGLSGFSAESMRRSDQKKNQQWLESEGEAAAGHEAATNWKLQFGEEHRDEEMES